MAKAKYSKDKQGRYYIDRTIGGKRCVLRAKTQAELDAKLRAWMDAQAAAQAEQELGPLFEDVAAAWWADASAALRPGTLAGYKAKYYFALDEYTGVRIAQIQPYQISASLKRLSAQGYSRKTIANYRIVFSRIFDHWINSPDFHGTHNPVTLAQMPSGAAKSQTRLPPSDAQLELIRQHPEGFGFAALLFMYTGLRRAEANGLQAKDIDINKNVYGINGGIYVHQTAPWAGNTPYIAATKTDAGVRWVPIFAPLRPILINRLKGLRPDDFVLSGSALPLTQSQYNARWNAYCASIGLSHPVEEPLPKDGKLYTRTRQKASVTAHQFRHYMATACYEADVPEMVAQKILGHADIATTHAVYTHIRDRFMAESANNLNAFFTHS